MPMNGYNAGRDLTVVITTSDGQLSTYNIVEFEAKENARSNMVSLMNGQLTPQKFPGGWNGSFTVERTDGSFDDFIAKQEADYFAGKNITGASITQLIERVSGGIDEYQFTNVIISMTDAGKYSGESSVKQSFSFMAARRIKRA